MLFVQLSTIITSWENNDDIADHLFMNLFKIRIYMKYVLKGLLHLHSLVYYIVI